MWLRDRHADAVSSLIVHGGPKKSYIFQRNISLEMVKLKKRAEKFDSALLNWHYIELLVKILCIFWFIVSFYIVYCMLLPTGE